jgi:hypothetical protein
MRWLVINIKFIIGEEQIAFVNVWYKIYIALSSLLIMNSGKFDTINCYVNSGYELNVFLSYFFPDSRLLLMEKL